MTYCLKKIKIMFIKNNLLRKMQFIYHQDLFINIVIALLTKVYSDVWYAFKLFYSQSNIYDVFTPLIIVRYMQFIRFKTVLFLSIIFNSIYTLLNTNYFIHFPIFHSFVDILYRKKCKCMSSRNNCISKNVVPCMLKKF